MLYFYCSELHAYDITYIRVFFLNITNIYIYDIFENKSFDFYLILICNKFII